MKRNIGAKTGQRFGSNEWKELSINEDEAEGGSKGIAMLRLD